MDFCSFFTCSAKDKKTRKRKNETFPTGLKIRDSLPQDKNPQGKNPAHSAADEKKEGVSMKPCTWKPDQYCVKREDRTCLVTAKAQDEELYLEGFRQIDPEALKLTASPAFEDEEVIRSAYRRFCSDPDRAFFVLKNEDGKILGEAVINDLDREKSEANFRIALFTSTARGHGTGTWMTEEVCRYAFEVMKLERLTLDVLQTNPRARKVYEKAGFVLDSSCEEEIVNITGHPESVVFDFMVLDTENWKAMQKNHSGSSNR